MTLCAGEALGVQEMERLQTLNSEGTLSCGSGTRDPSCGARLWGRGGGPAKPRKVLDCVGLPTGGYQ